MYREAMKGQGHRKDLGNFGDIVTEVKPREKGNSRAYAITRVQCLQKKQSFLRPSRDKLHRLCDNMRSPFDNMRQTAKSVESRRRHASNHRKVLCYNRAKGWQVVS